MRGLCTIGVVGSLCFVLAGCDYFASHFTRRDQGHSPWAGHVQEKTSSEQDVFTQSLPPGVKMDTVVEVRPDGAKVTVESRLLELRAHPGGNGKFYDSNGREIRFYVHAALTGKTPAENATILQKQSAELAALREQYTVIELAGQ